MRYSGTITLRMHVKQIWSLFSKNLLQELKVSEEAIGKSSVINWSDVLVRKGFLEEMRTRRR